MKPRFLLSILATTAFACGGSVDSPRSDPASAASAGDPAGSANGGPSSGGGSASGSASRGEKAPTPTCETSCDEGHRPVAGAADCAAGDACYTRTSCGTTITCTGPAGLCEDPECLGSFYEVNGCTPDAICEVQRFCDRELICQASDAQCDGVPACDEGDTEVASAAACADHGSACYARRACGDQTWCVRKS